MSFHYWSLNTKKSSLQWALKELGGNNFRDTVIDYQSLKAKNLNENLP